LIFCALTLEVTSQNRIHQFTVAVLLSSSSFFMGTPSHRHILQNTYDWPTGQQENRDTAVQQGPSLRDATDSLQSNQSS
jgi:hypothetical protein